MPWKMGDSVLSIGSLSVHSPVSAVSAWQCGVWLVECKHGTGKGPGEQFSTHSSRKGQCILIGPHRAPESVTGCKGMTYPGLELSLCPGGRNGEGDQTGDRLVRVTSLSSVVWAVSGGWDKERVAPMWQR